MRARADRVRFVFVFGRRCLEPSSRDSPYWEEACDTSSKDFGKRWLVYDDAMGDVREPDGTEEVDSQVTRRSAPCYVGWGMVIDRVHIVSRS